MRDLKCIRRNQDHEDCWNSSRHSSTYKKRPANSGGLWGEGNEIMDKM